MKNVWLVKLFFILSFLFFYPINNLGAELLFTDITNSAIRGSDEGGHGAVWADIDGDDDPDVYVTRNYSFQQLPDLLFVNSSGQGFSEEGAARGIDDTDTGTHGAVWADLDNDGDYDLWNGAHTINNLYLNDGTGYFTDVTALAGIEKDDGRTRGVVAFDMDNDGDLDLFANNWGDEVGQENELYRNEGNMTFTSVSGGDLTAAIGSQGATGGDLDGDGDVDIVLSDFFGDHSVYVFLNDSNGVFTLQDNSVIGLPGSGRYDGVTLGDLNNDGYLDLIIADPAEKSVYLNNGDGSFYFRDSFSAPGYMAAVGDFDNDGDLDFYCPGDDHIFLNNGSAEFIPISNVGIPNTSSEGPRCASLADIDNDGDLDIMNIHKDGYNVLLRNDLVSSNSWIKIKLVRQGGQIGAFGSKMHIYDGGYLGDTDHLVGFQEVMSQQGYLAQNEPISLFGVGERESVDIRIVFPGGVTQDFVDHPTNSMLTVTENQPPDTTPPSWDSDVGICSAVDTESGGSVSVEFGSATDDVDGSNVRYNIYYDPTSTWDNDNWSNNSSILNVSPVAGTVCANSFTLTGLQNDVEYTFGVRVSDKSGNEDSNTITVTSMPSGTYDLLLSLSSDHSNPVSLEGEIVTGDIYVFTSPDVGVSQVQFFLDDPQMSGDPIQIENIAPYDFAGSTSGQVYGKPYDTIQLSDGTHEITALLKLDGGGNDIVSSTFTVANNEPQLVFTPDTLAFSVEEGGNASSQTTVDTSDGISTSYTVDDDATWLTVTPASGSTPATLNVSIDATGLTPGVYAATVTAIAMGYIEDTVGVTLTVTSSGSIYDLLLSLSPDRSNPVYLDSETVTGDIYVFTSPDVGVSQVQFFLDDPQMTGDPIQIENLAPYDFAASTSGQVYGKPYDTTQLPDGTHEITALIKLDDGGTEVVSSSFTVDNN